MTKTNRSLGVLAASAAGVLAAVGMLLLTMLLLGESLRRPPFRDRTAR
jgi:hypothetical protein